MSDPVARLVLCVPGPWADDTALTVLLGEAVDWERTGRDERLPEAFRASMDRMGGAWPSDPGHDVEGHAAVVYLLSPEYTAEQAAGQARNLLQAGTLLLSAGGLGMKCDSAGIAHPPSRWQALNEAADLAYDKATGDDVDADEQEGARQAFWTALFRSFVRMPIHDGEVLFTCGMHLLGLPDVEVPLASLDGDDVSAAVHALAGFALYLASEAPRGSVGDGEGFRAGPGAPRYVLSSRPCSRYDEGDLFYNPWGVWRLAPEA